MKPLHLKIATLALAAAVSTNIAAQSSSRAVEQLEKDLGVELGFTAYVTAAGQQFSISGTIQFDGKNIAVQTPSHNLWYNGKEAYTQQKNGIYNELYISVPQDADTLLFRPLEILAISKSECSAGNRLERVYGEYADYTFDVRIDRYIRTGVRFDSTAFIPKTDSIPNLEIIDLR